MAITLYNAKKWTKMLLGKSIMHVNQDEGKCYSVSEICGYYNNLTEKVTKAQPDEKIPTMVTQFGQKIYFPIAVFQFGLGAYDLYLIHNENIYYEKFMACAEWAVQNQEENGGWSNFFYIYPKAPYSAMAQGEGISLLLRAYKETGNNIYWERAKKALEFMIAPIENGGTAYYDGEDIYLMEYTHKSVVLNGWIFSVFGIIDFLKIEPKNKEISEIYEKTIKTMIKSLGKFDCGYWSLYCADGLICSPFYHRLHIAQLSVLHKLTGNEQFLEYKKKWSRYNDNKLYKTKAFIRKAIEKIKE